MPTDCAAAPPPGNIWVVIPAYNPAPPLVALAATLMDAGAARLVVVDDGSAPAHRPVVTAVARQGAIVLIHPANRGKGRALKTAFAYCRTHARPPAGVVTADADGQHDARDILQVACCLARNPEALVLGTRRFGAGVPLRNYWGNRLMRHLFHYLVGTRLTDTQSGLRGIPFDLLADLERVGGERYDYETAMLMFCRRRAVPLRQVPIRTLYPRGNRDSHFRPLQDAAAIMSRPLAVGAGCLAASVLDVLAFCGLRTAGVGVAVSVVAARAVWLVLGGRLTRLGRPPARGTRGPRVLATGAVTLAGGTLMAALAYGAGHDARTAKIVGEIALWIGGFSFLRDVLFTGRVGR